MANKIIIKNGDGAPGADTLQSSELGFDKENKKLYIGLEGENTSPLLVNPPEVTVDLNGASSSEIIQTINADSLGGVPASDYLTEAEAEEAYLPKTGGTLTGNVSIGSESNTSALGLYIRRILNDIQRACRVYWNVDSTGFRVQTQKTVDGTTSTVNYLELRDDDTKLYKPLRIDSGGTGATTTAGIKTNLGVGTELWSGEWSSGDITVPDTDKYTVFLMKLSNYSAYFPVIKYGSNLRGLGGYSSAESSTITIGFSGTFSGNTWTFAGANSTIQKSDGTHTLTARTVQKIIGLI